MYKLKIVQPRLLKVKFSVSFPPIILANLQEKTVVPLTEEVVVTADDRFDGLSKVTVGAIPSEYIIPSGELDITENGTYDVTNYVNANVNIPEKQLGTKTITSNGTYKATDDNLDGYSEVEVATSGVDINEYLSDTIIHGESLTGGWVYTIKKIRSPLTIEGTDASYMFYKYLLNELPQIDTSNVTNMKSMFSNCTNLTTIPLLDTSSVTDMNNMFYNCTNLTTMPQIVTSNVTNMNYMFGACRLLTSIPQLDTSKVTNIGYMFSDCMSLVTIPQINGEKLTSVGGTFNNCKSLENFNGIINLGQAYLTTQSANYFNYKLNLSACTNLTYDSLMNVINSLYDIATLGVKPQQLILGDTNLAKLTEEEIAIATNKGWSVS